MLNQGKIVRCSWEKFQSISHDPDILYVIKDKGQIWMGDKCIADTPKDIWSLGIVDTEVGKAAKITEVDEDGKPIAWEAVDGVEAFNRQGDWNQNESTKPDYVKNRTHYRVEEHIDEKQYDLPSADNLLPLVLGEEWYAKGRYSGTPDKYLPQGDKVLLPVVTNSSGDLCICSDGYTDFATGSEKYNCFVVYADHMWQDPSWKSNARAEVQVLYRAAYSKVQYKTIDENYIPTTIPRTLSASAGDILRVKSVDENGKPQEWEAVENPTETLTVNLTMGGDESITADKTFAEIKEAYDNGKIVTARFMETGCVPLISIDDSHAIFQVMSDNQVLYFQCETRDGSDTWDFVFRDMATAADARSLGMSGASVGQIVKVKEVDSSGRPTKWEAATDSTPFIVEFGGSGTESDPYTSSHTYAQIMEAISAGRHVVGYSEYIFANVDSCYGAYFNLFNTQDAASFEFIDSKSMFSIIISVSDDFGVQVYGSYLDAKSYIYGGVKADDAEETDTQPVRKGADGKLYTSIPQSNWDQNDLRQSDYIKNRTHKREEVLVPSFTLRGTARATAAGAKIKTFTVDSKTGERPTSMSVYCRVSGDPPILLPKIGIPSYTIDEYSTYGYGDPSLFGSEAYEEGAPSVHDNGLDIGVGATSAEPNGWIIRVSSDSKYFDYEEIELEFGTSYETVYTPLDENYIPMTVPRAASVSVGDILRVKSIDSEGKPTEWEAISIPQSDWNQADETAADYIKNRPFGNVAYDGILFGEYGSNGWRLERVPDASAFYGIQGTRQAEIRGSGSVIPGSANISASDYDGSVNIEYTSTSGHTIINISGKYGVIDNINVQSSEGIGGWGTYELHIDGLYYEGYIKLSADKVDIDTKSLGLTGAAAGDILRVKAVDDHGKPTEWETISTTDLVNEVLAALPAAGGN